MSRIKLLLLAAAIGLGLPLPALAASSNVNSLTASGAIVGTQLFYCPIGATTDLKCSAAQIAAYNYSLMSGDCTASGTGAITCTKTSGTAFSGLATLAGSTAGDLAYYNGTTWVRLAGNASGTNFLQETSAGVPSWAAGTSAGVSSFSSTCPASGPSTGAVTFTNSLTDLAKTGTYAGAWTTDCGAAIKFTLSGAATYTLPAPSTDGNYISAITNVSTSTSALTIAAASGTINGAASISLAINQSISVWCDTTNCYASTLPALSTATGPGYETTRFYFDRSIAASSAGTVAPVLLTAYCTPLWINNVSSAGGGTMTLGSLSFNVTTLFSGGNVQLALYSNGSNNRPSTLIGATGSLSTTSTGWQTGTITVSGIAQGQDWTCAQSDNTTVRWTIGNVAAGQMANVGVAALTNINSNIAGGVSTTTGITSFGTWPSLSAATWTSTSVIAPMVVIQPTSIP